MPRNLSGVQFRYSAPQKRGFAFHEIQVIAPEATRKQDMVSPTGKVISGGGKGLVVGTLQWHPKTGDVNWVRTHQDYRGLGVATTLWEKAKKLSADTGIKAPEHSKHRTPEGEVWAKQVGGNLPTRAKWDWR
jgi:GNAT superfamily N-acetyltransferase